MNNQLCDFFTGVCVMFMWAWLQENLMLMQAKGAGHNLLEKKCRRLSLKIKVNIGLCFFCGSFMLFLSCFVKLSCTSVY